MLAPYICDYLKNTGEICANGSTKIEGCYLHWKCKKRYSCIGCKKSTNVDNGFCSRYNRSYYSMQYVERLREKAEKYKNSIAKT